MPLADSLCRGENVQGYRLLAARRCRCIYHVASTSFLTQCQPTERRCSFQEGNDSAQSMATTTFSRDSFSALTCDPQNPRDRLICVPVVGALAGIQTLVASVAGHPDSAQRPPAGRTRRHRKPAQPNRERNPWSPPSGAKRAGPAAL